MIICTAEQGSREWLKDRAGVITASRFAEVRARLKVGPQKGGFSRSALDYAFELAVERIAGEPVGGVFETWQMTRGRELEPEAIRAYESRTWCDVQRVGLICDDDRRFGASADGLIGDKGGLEVKCYTDPAKLRAILIDGDVSMVADQVIGGMWITGREWWDVALYCPALAPIGREMTIVRIERDEGKIADLEADLIEFEAVVSGFEAKLKEVT